MRVASVDETGPDAHLTRTSLSDRAGIVTVGNVSRVNGNTMAITLSELETHLWAVASAVLDTVVNRYKPGSRPMVVDYVARDIDASVKQVSYSAWVEDQSGDRTVRKGLHAVLKNYGLPLTGNLFDHACPYVRENH